MLSVRGATVALRMLTNSEGQVQADEVSRVSQYLRRGEVGFDVQQIAVWCNSGTTE